MDTKTQPQAIAEVMQRIHRAGTIDIRPEVAAHSWDFVAYHPDLAPVLPAVQAFCSAVLDDVRPKRWLSLLGPSGVGKTHLLKQALRFLGSRMRIKTKTGWRGAEVAHINPLTDLGDWRAAADYARYDLIYIEDIGAGGDAEAGAGRVVLSRLRELLQLRSGRWTMLDANLYRKRIAATLDGRIASRLKRDGSWMIEIPETVPDFWDVPKHHHHHQHS